MYTKYKPVVNMGANHSHVTIYMVQSMAPKASFSTLCAHNCTLVHVLSKKFLHKIIGQDGQDLAQEAKILPRILSKILGKILGKIMAANLGILDKILGKSWAS